MSAGSGEVGGDDTNRAGKYAALLATTEVGIGSVLHAWSVPLAGHILSLNQGFLLCRSMRGVGRSSSLLPFRISIIAALLKSLSPAGKRLTPMLAISVQGLLYSVGQYFFGPGVVGHLVSATLLGLWAFVQPVLIYLLIFGPNIVKVGAYFINSMQSVLPLSAEFFVCSLAVLIGLKCLLSVGVVYLARSRSELNHQNYDQRLSVVKWGGQFVGGLSIRQKLGLVASDLLQPWFIFSIGLTALFLYLTEPRGVRLVWLMLRPLAVGMLVFYGLRFLPVDRWLIRLLGSPESTSSRIYLQALRALRGEAALHREKVFSPNSECGKNI